MDAKLRVVSGAKDAVIRLKLPTVIGRSGTANLTVKSSRVSRQHCEIDLFEGELTVRDLGSSNGTFVNGHRISDVTFLSPGDQLTVGKLTLQAEYEVGAPAGDEPRTSIRTEPSEATQSETTDNAAISSTVHYQEDSEGSFLGIEELVQVEADVASEQPVPTHETCEASSVPPSKIDAPNADAPNADAPSADASSDNVSSSDMSTANASNAESVELEIGERAKPVDPGDSQLNKFLNGLS